MKIAPFHCNRNIVKSLGLKHSRKHASLFLLRCPVKNEASSKIGDMLINVVSLSSWQK